MANSGTATELPCYAISGSRAWGNSVAVPELVPWPVAPRTGLPRTGFGICVPKEFTNSGTATELPCYAISGSRAWGNSVAVPELVPWPVAPRTGLSHARASALPCRRNSMANSGTATELPCYAISGSRAWGNSVAVPELVPWPVAPRTGLSHARASALLCRRNSNSHGYCSPGGVPDPAEVYGRPTRMANSGTATELLSN